MPEILKKQRLCCCLAFLKLRRTFWHLTCRPFEVYNASHTRRRWSDVAAYAPLMRAPGWCEGGAERRWIPLRSRPAETMQVGRAGSDPLPFCEQCRLLMRPEAAFGEAEVVPRDDAPFVSPPPHRGGNEGRFLLFLTLQPGQARLKIIGNHCREVVL